MSIIIYGAGHNCHMAIKKSNEAKVEIVCIVDRDESKIGTTIEGYAVASVDKVKEFPDSKIVISVNSGRNDIKTDLINMGVSENRIIHMDDFFVVHEGNTGSMKADWSKGLFRKDIYDELCKNSGEYSKLEREYLLGEHRMSYKWLHYFEVYNRHLERFYNRDVTIMEIGVKKGGSLQLWKKVFGEGSTIYGLDIDPECKKFEEEGITVFIGDQGDRDFLRKVKEETPKVDILIDDGGHYMDQQITSFKELFDHIKEDGVYICEDTGSSYDPVKYNSGREKENTFIEFSKRIIDDLHEWVCDTDAFYANEYAVQTHSVHYYPGIMVVEKRKMRPPFDMEVCNYNGEKYAIPHLHGRI